MNRALKSQKCEKPGCGVFPSRGHNHGACIANAINDAEELCAQTGARLTPLRRTVLKLVWQGHKPLGAYDILQDLRKIRPSAEPPTVYRALEFLLELGLIHRIERLNAYVGCPHPGKTHEGQFLICRSCGRAAELHDTSINKALTNGAAGVGFVLENPMVEVEGLCPNCIRPSNKINKNKIRQANG